MMKIIIIIIIIIIIKLIYFRKVTISLVLICKGQSFYHKCLQKEGKVS